MKNPVIFTSSSYEYMKDELATSELASETGSIERKIFPDGERYQRITHDIANRDVIIVSGLITDQDTLEVYDLACAIAKYGAKRLILMIPYFGYSTMERSTKVGEVVPAKTRARLLSSIPTCPKGNYVFMLDLHSEGLPYYFEGNIRPIHLYAKNTILNMINEIGYMNDYVLACTDAGRAKWVESLANELKVDASFVFKKRLGGDKTEVTAVRAQVEGRKVIIYDDMIRTGGSLVGAAKAYFSSGASGISVVTTHGVFCHDKEHFSTLNLFDRIAFTNSHVRSNLSYLDTTKAKDGKNLYRRYGIEEFMLQEIYSFFAKD